MENKKKFSISAKILIVLLAVRFISQIYIFFLSITNKIDFISLLFFGIIGLIILFYGIALVGVIKKTSWGLNFVIAIAILDVIFTGILDLVMGTLGNAFSIGAIIVDVILIILAGNIAKRIKR